MNNKSINIFNWPLCLKATANTKNRDALKRAEKDDFVFSTTTGDKNSKYIL